MITLTIGILSMACVGLSALIYLQTRTHTKSMLAQQSQFCAMLESRQLEITALTEAYLRSEGKQVNMRPSTKGPVIVPDSWQSSRGPLGPNDPVPNVMSDVASRTRTGL